MLVKTNSTLFKLLLKLPLWLPISIQPVRIGKDIRSFVKVSFYSWR